jgi:hypothetical protein
MTTRILKPSRDDLEARRKRLLERLGMNREEAGRAADAGVLSGEQIWIWEDLRSVEFLLGDDGRRT